MQVWTKTGKAVDDSPERHALVQYGPALAKLLVITPLIFLALRQVDVLPKSEALIGGLVALYFVADVLASLVARGRGASSKLGRVLDRAADYPLLVVVAWFSRDAVAEPLLRDTHSSNQFCINGCY